MMLVTLFALIGDDFRILTIEDKANDKWFWIANIFSLLFFSIELILSSLVNKNGYFLGFFFWLDLISTLSILMDIGYFTEFI